MAKYFREIKFDRNELAGAFGDIGTDFPLMIGMILASNLDSASVLIMFGVWQIFTGLYYKMPMPVQPLKAMATLVITQKLGANILYGGGLAIGLTMFLLSITRLIDWIGKIVPKSVIRGIQFGLGMKLGLLALSDYIPSDGINGYGLAILAFLIIIFLLGNRKYPPAIFVILAGIIYAFIFKIDGNSLTAAFGLKLPRFYIPTFPDILTGFIILALPQIPLSIGNSVLATKQIAQDLYPQKPLPLQKISMTYSLMNLINPFLSGVPTCHGSGGMVGHYTFGGRTGGSVIIYGSLYIVLGMFLSNGFHHLINIFPLPILGILLLFEGIGLMFLIKDLTSSKQDFMIALFVGLIASGMKCGFVIALIAGTLLHYLAEKNLVHLNDKS
jgi:hypothetical protein